ncbi:TolC family protein [Phenylobacterium aquaticum]|uniref:TolC family protein n=1 Tax=Phenylobacterium aquaticum TaxID=1763816 RepID=UPI0026F13011|nr:TolC family protein [Phenylobacterium aquaticum]
MRRRAVPALAALAALGACQTYAPAPVRLDAFPAALAARGLDEKPAGAVWTGADLLAAAIARNPDIAQARARYRAAEAAARTARVRPAATLTLTAEYAQESSPWLYGAAADLPVDAGARRAGRLTAADLAALQARYDYVQSVWTVRMALTKARIGLRAADEALRLTRDLVELRDQRAGRLNERVVAGEDARPSALVAATELAVARHRQTDALARAAQAEAALAAALGVSPAAVAGLRLAPVEAGPDLPVTASQRAEAAGARADVLRALADYDAAEAALRVEVARQYPEVRLGPGYSWDHGLAKLPFNLGLTLPPADLNRAAIAEAEARRAEAGRGLEAAQAQVLAAIDQAAAALAAARLQDEIARTHDLPAADRAARAAALSLKAGAADRTDDLAARAALDEAALTVAEARMTLALAALDLEDALRRPADPAQAELMRAAVAQLETAK